MTMQTMSENVAPPFCYYWTYFWSTFWSSNYAYHISFQSLGSQESRALNGAQFGVETKKLWSFEDKRAKLSGNFAAETPFGRLFRSCETTFWNTSAICSTVPLILKLRYSCEITFAKPLFDTRVPFRSPVHSFCSCEMSCEINFGLRNHFWALKWLRNHLQASKWPSNCEIDLRNEGRFAKTPCKAKGSC